MPNPIENIRLRLALASDVPALRALIEQSVRCLQAHDYTPAQIDGALGTALGVNTQLIADQTYFVAEIQSPASQPLIAGCGGWSNRRTLFGSDHAQVRENALLDPALDAAKIRAIFVHPVYARRGLGSLILQHCEQAAIQAGFHRFEMGSTLTGVPLYKLRGYQECERVEVPLPNGETLPVIRMTRTLVSPRP